MQTRADIRDFVLGTRNQKKRAELDQLLRPFGFDVKSLDDVHSTHEVIEDGSSFAANAAKKAREQAQFLGQWVLGEDSGICVDALDGRPRYLFRQICRGRRNWTWPITNCSYSGCRAFQEKRERPTTFATCHCPIRTGTIRIECEAICRGILRCEPAGTWCDSATTHSSKSRNTIRTFGELGSAVKAVLSQSRAHFAAALAASTAIRAIAPAINP